MGMKSKSAHFGSGAGGPSTRLGSHPKVNLQFFAKMPKQRAQIKHIMANRKGHMPDTKKNRNKLEKISSNSSNYVRSDPRGFKVYSKVSNGKEYWVHVRRGIIQNGGINMPGEFKYHLNNGFKKGGK